MKNKPGLCYTSKCKRKPYKHYRLCLECRSRRKKQRIKLITSPGYKGYVLAAEWQLRLRVNTLNKLKGQCCFCKFKDARALQITLKEGRVSLLRRTMSWSMFYNHVAKHPEQFILLCANCMWIRRACKKEATGRPRLYGEAPK